MKKVLALGMIMVVLLGGVRVSRAIIPVWDEVASLNFILDFGYTLADYAAQAEQIANQVLQYEQLVLQVESWALALKNLQFDSLPIIGGPMGAFMEVFAKAQDAFFNAAVIQEQFKALYAPFHGELLSGQAFAAKAFDWNEATRQAHSIAMQQQASAVVSIEAMQEAIPTILGKSHGAVGQLQAQQAGTEMLGAIASQQVSTNALLATMAHTQSIKEMNEAAIRDQALLRAAGVLENFTTMPTSVQGLATLPTQFQ